MSGSRWEPSRRGAVTQARQRLGAEPVREVFQRLARPAATPATAGAWLGRWRLMAIDGFVLDLPDTPANAEEFPKDSVGGYETVFPQARVAAVSECASHAIVAVDVPGCRGSEQTLAYSLYERLEADMLLLADRGFYSFYAWGQARRTGAQLVWRVQAGLRPYRLRDLDDGPGLRSSPTLRWACTGHKRTGCVRMPARAGPLEPARVMIVRVVDYTVPDRKGDHIRLITTILGPADTTAE